MSRVCDSVCKLCRRENVKLFLKGDRCLTDKCAFERRPYPPGQHGQSRIKFSDFALQLREKQKTKRWFGLSEKQFRKHFESAGRSKELTGTALLRELEIRLDNVVYTLGLSSSRREARQMITHNHILVNGKRCNIPSMLLKKGDSVEVVDAAKNHVRVLGAAQTKNRRAVPNWLELISEQFKGTVKDMPLREEILVPSEENMIVEYYSR